MKCFTGTAIPKKFTFHKVACHIPFFVEQMTNYLHVSHLNKVVKYLKNSIVVHVYLSLLNSKQRVYMDANFVARTSVQLSIPE